MADTLTHSRLATYRSCPRLHYYVYELGLRKVTDDFNLRVGSAFHEALDAKAKGLDPEAAIGERLEDAYDQAMVAAMFDGHNRRYEKEPVETVASELAFDIPLVNPETGSPTQNWRLCGVIDRIVRLADGRLALMENKTTSQDFSPGASYWLKLHLDSQLSIYIIAARTLGYDIDTILYDVTRRPSQRPLKATPVEKRKFTKDGALYLNQRAEDEKPEEYAARVAAAIAEDPSKHYARIEIARLDSDIEEVKKEIWEQQKAIREAQKSKAWYRNPGSCIAASGRTCDFIGVCMNKDLETHTPDGFERVAERHPELVAHAKAPG